MWSLYEDGKELKPLAFSNGKTQEDVVREVIQAVDEGFKVIFIRGMCGTGKSAIALNLARKYGKTSIVVPIKSLQEQYTKDYTNKKYILRDEKFLASNFPDIDNYPELKNSKKLDPKLKISPIVGRKNFNCNYLKETGQPKYSKEVNARLNDIFIGNQIVKDKDNSCDNLYLPCKIEIKEKNLPKIKDYIKKNPDVHITDFDSIKEVRRMTLAPVCPYWSPIVPSEFEIKKFKDAKKISYMGLEGRRFTIYQRMKGCPYYDQYEAYSDSDVLIFNSLKYKLETLMNRKPLTEIEIIDECDEFLDSFANQEQINLSRLSFALTLLFPESKGSQKIIEELINLISDVRGYQNSEEIFPIKDTPVEKILLTLLKNQDFLDEVEIDESSYLFHLDKVARIFHDFLDETYFSIEEKEKSKIVNVVTTNLEKRFQELIEKNKIIIMMSGTLHSESVLRNIFGLKEFKIIDAEIHHPGELIKEKTGKEVDCKYENFRNNTVTRESYLKTLSDIVSHAKKPALVHLTSFSDLPTNYEKDKYSLDNLPIQEEIIREQKEDPFGKRIDDFKKKKIDTLFTTKCSRGLDFPGDTCNSIILTRFPYPNISSIFWKILKKTNPQNFMSFYMDKARRELLQRIYRGLRSKDDTLHLLSPDIRILNYNID